MLRSRYCFGLCRGIFCGTAARHPLPSSGRKVSRGSVTEGARGTERWQKAAVFRCFQVNPSPASREPPLPQGSHGSVRFSALCRRENRSKNQGFKTESGSKTKVAHSPSVAFGASSLSEGAFDLCDFFPLCRKENFFNISENIRDDFPVVQSGFLCGTRCFRGQSLFLQFRERMIA